MAQLENFVDMTGSMSQEQVNAQNISAIMDEMNRGTDATTIQRRAISAGQIRILSYQPNPIQLLTLGGSGTIAAGAYGYRIIDFTNTALTNPAGQTFIPTIYVDWFIDPSDTSSTAALYATNSDFPTGSNVTSSMAQASFNRYLRNSTPVSSGALVSYVFTVRNDDSVSHAYWFSAQMLLPADDNLNNGNTAVYLP